MPSKAEALGIFLILVPGFTCAYIAQYLSVRRKQTELDKVVEALLFSVLLYLLTLPFFGNTLPAYWRPSPDNTNSTRFTFAGVSFWRSSQLPSCSEWSMRQTSTTTG